MGQDFSPALQGGTGMSLNFLDPPYPAPPCPCPVPPRIAKGYNCKFFTLKPNYLNKHINISLFYSTQCGSLPLFCYVLYYEILFFIFFYIDCLVKHLNILFNFFYKN